MSAPLAIPDRRARLVADAHRSSARSWLVLIVGSVVAALSCVPLVVTWGAGALLVVVPAIALDAYVFAASLRARREQLALADAALRPSEQSPEQ